MKASRHRNYLAEILDESQGNIITENPEEDSFDNQNRNNNLDKTHLFNLIDFISPELIPLICPDQVRDDEDDDKNGVIRESDVKRHLLALVEEDEYEFEDSFTEEEEWDDEQILAQCFEIIETNYDISDCDCDQIIFSLREMNYDLTQFNEFLEQGIFGSVTTKKVLLPSILDEPAFEIIQTNSNKFKQKQSSSQTQNLPVIPSKEKEIENIKLSLQSLKERLNLVIIGHVDAGKSTLVGHLLAMSGCVEHSRLAAIDKETKRTGKEDQKWAWIMAEDATERERGITIDVSSVEFETPNKLITLLDAPGHKDFIPNMIAGASNADAALLVIDAVNPLIENSQAIEHLFLCRSLGVNNIIIAINKMDSVAYSKAAFDAISHQMTQFLLKNYGIIPQFIIPIAAQKGFNLINDKNTKEMDWYSGLSIIEAIDSLKITHDLPNLIEEPFLMCISHSYEVSGKIFVSGKIEKGFIKKGMKLKIINPQIKLLQNSKNNPNLKDSIGKVQSIKINNKDVDFAVFGTIVDIGLNIQLKPENIINGSALTSIEEDIAISNDFIARINTFDMKMPLLKGSDLVFYRHTIELPIKIINLNSIIDRKTKQITQNNPSFIPKNSCADIHFRLNSPISLEIHSKSKAFGRFVLRAGGQTLGFGSIVEILQSKN